MFVTCKQTIPECTHPQGAPGEAAGLGCQALIRSTCVGAARDTACSALQAGGAAGREVVRDAKVHGLCCPWQGGDDLPAIQ